MTGWSLSAPATTAARTDRLGWLPLVALVAVLLLLAWTVGGVVLDILAAIHSPLELDYGEGIVWQQAALIPGPRMYAVATGLPFIVFHYPPLFHLLARAALTIEPDFLAAGRLVAGASTLTLIPLVAGLVGSACPRESRTTVLAVACAVTAGLLVACVDVVRSWGVLMRVDMPGLVCGLAGLLVACRADGRFWGTACALLLCLAAVFTKQTLLSYGIAVFLVALFRRPYPALAAAALVGAIGIAIVLGLQAVTDGGFLQNLVGFNINRFSTEPLIYVAYSERYSLVLLVAFVAAAVWLAGCTIRALPPKWQAAPLISARRALLLLHFALASLVLLTLFKAGASVNYLLEWVCTGCIVLGVALADLGRAGPASRLVFAGLLLVIGLTIARQPSRRLPDQPDPAALATARNLVERIRAASLPVASENMVLLMQAGQDVVYEPAIVTELAHVGRWDESMLVDLIRRHGFAFMLTLDGTLEPGKRRTPAVNAAMAAAYPRLHQLGPRIWLREAS